MNNFPGGSCLVFNRNSKVPRVITPVTIGYKYNYYKVIYFIIIKGGKG